MFHLKGESRGQACRSYMIVNVILMDRQNFFFHFTISPSAGGLPGTVLLAKIIRPVSVIGYDCIALAYNRTRLIIRPRRLSRTAGQTARNTMF